MLRNFHWYSGTISYLVITRHCAKCPGYLERNTAEKDVCKEIKRDRAGGGVSVCSHFLETFLRQSGEGPAVQNWLF